ncbi:MAG: type II secretion system protein GspG [Parcubacteria group bacterium CG11_big_fil_rev_8_21_14_0_20_39_22]|nr:MAG: type II secretion system protein GspG [Parcubacteria group bacterium CG11_big_fil_rev_8_21_14_0_20_39_22]
MLKTKRGFTLIELLVVIAIIGILSSVVLASLNTARQKARDARRIADIKQIQTALELYFDSEGNYPSGLTDLVTSNFIPAVPDSPGTTNEYVYTVPSGGADYVLSVTLEDAGHTALSGDLDGTVLTIGCNDPVYCVKP